MNTVILGDKKWRLTLMELAVAGWLPSRQAIKPLTEELRRLAWVMPADGRYVINPNKKDNIETLLDRTWPSWRDIAQRMEGDYTDEKHRQVTRTGAGTLNVNNWLDTGRVYNEKTVSALAGAHSKSKVKLSGITSIRDYASRLRPNRGLEIHKQGKTWDAIEMAEIFGEILVSERSVREGYCFQGTMPRGILVCENPAAYYDVVVDGDIMVILGMGNNQPAVIATIELLPCNIPVFWFGDLDAEGVSIRRSFLNLCRSPARAAIPEFWEEYMDAFARPAQGSWQGIDVSMEPAIVKTLSRKDEWLEQEPVAIDPRFKDWLNSHGILGT
jgi:hypothetical protein